MPVNVVHAGIPLILTDTGNEVLNILENEGRKKRSVWTRK